MIDSVASQTAQFTALMRAVHTRCDPAPIFHDPWADRLVPQSTVEALRARVLSSMNETALAAAKTTPASIVDDYLRSSAAYTTAITRSRYAEDALRVAVGRGVRQYVLIGAGFDSFCLRRDALAMDVDIYEIDHPATQTLKRRRFDECGLVLPHSVHFIAADLSSESLASALTRSAFRDGEPAFLSWLGVSMYLTREANIASLRAIAHNCAQGSELVFTYLHDRIFRVDAPTESESFVGLCKRVADVGEPFLSGFDPGTIESVLRDAGLLLIEDLDDTQLVERYDSQDANGFAPLAPSRIAHVRIADHRWAETPMKDRPSAT